MKVALCYLFKYSIGGGDSDASSEHAGLGDDTLRDGWNSVNIVRLILKARGQTHLNY